MKKNLSARGADDISYEIPNMFEGDVATGVFTKEDFETACTRAENLFDKFYHIVFDTVQAVVKEERIDTVVISGSAMRTPRLQEELLRAVHHAGHEVEAVNNTLNLEEACAVRRDVLRGEAVRVLVRGGVGEARRREHHHGEGVRHAALRREERVHHQRQQRARGRQRPRL